MQVLRLHWWEALPVWLLSNGTWRHIRLICAPFAPEPSPRHAKAIMSNILHGFHRALALLAAIPDGRTQNNSPADVDYLGVDPRCYIRMALAEATEEDSL
jgi:hypothetical protein